MDRLQQLEICEEHGSPFVEALDHQRLGVAKNVRTGLKPLNGLRVEPTVDTCGWFIWAGTEWSTADDHFDPVHVIHVREFAPQLEQFLGLAPGWRFLVADDYVDVWYDPELLK